MTFACRPYLILAAAVMGLSLRAVSPPFPELSGAPPAPVPTLESSITPTLQDDWIDLHKALSADAHARAKEIQIVLLGDSITARWTRGAGRELYAERYAPFGSINLGISADATQHVLWRLQHGVLDGVHPKMVLLLIGTNNWGEQPDAVAYGVWSVVKELRTGHPETRVLVEGIFPRVNPHDPAQGAKIPVINQLLAKLDDGKMVKFIDFGSKFLKPDGSFDWVNFPDGTHPEKAPPFQIWADSVQPTVDAWLKEPPLPNVPPPPSPVPVPADLLSSTPAPRNDWLYRFNRSLAQAKKGNCDLLFLGGTIMSYWDRMPDLFKQEYGADKPLNFANWGSRTENVLYELQNGGVDGLKPRLVVIQLQMNVLDQTPAENVAAGMAAIAQMLHAKLPGSKILLEGAFPKGATPADPLRQKIAHYNELLSKLADNKTVYFLDVGTAFTHPDGTVDPTPEQNVSTPAVMKQWADAQRAEIAKLMTP